MPSNPYDSGNGLSLTSLFGRDPERREERVKSRILRDPDFLKAVDDATLKKLNNGLRFVALRKRFLKYQDMKRKYRGGNSSLLPGFKYSFSGADAKAWAYYPQAGMIIEEKKAQLKQQLDRANQTLEYIREGQRVDWAVEDWEVGLQTDDNNDFRVQKIERLEEELFKLPYSDFYGWVPLESMATISINIHEPRSQVRALGHRGIKGFAGSVRTIAGTMIFTIVDGHPLRELMLIDDEVGKTPARSMGWSIDNFSRGRGTAYDEYDGVSKLATMLTPFDLKIFYKSEYLPSGLPVQQYGKQPSPWTVNGAPVGNIPLVNRGTTKENIAKEIGAAIQITGLQIISEAYVTSVNDIVTEIQYQFMAEDVKEFVGTVYSEMMASFDFEAEALGIADLTSEQLLRDIDVPLNEYKQTETYKSEYAKQRNQLLAAEVKRKLGNDKR
jgi:hypothetical protein